MMVVGAVLIVAGFVDFYPLYRIVSASTRSNEWAATGTPQGDLQMLVSDPILIESAKDFVSEYPNATIGVSCKSSTRVYAAATKFRKTGIENIDILKGGIIQ